MKRIAFAALLLAPSLAFAQAGANMTNAAKAAYALDQIDLARADLLRVEESP